jgi:hypothetical protein
MNRYFFYHDSRHTGLRGETTGRVSCEVSSVGWKWVKIRIGTFGRFRKIPRKVWDEIQSDSTTRTVKEEQAHIDFCNAINDSGIAWSRPYRGKQKFKTHEVLEAELEHFNTVKEWKGTQ